MPDFTEILKIAVEQQDWQLICGLYTNITGEPLLVPATATANEAEEEKPIEDILGKEYSLDELKYQNQLPPQEQDAELVDKDIDKEINNRYNDFTAPPRNYSGESGENRRMRSEPVGSGRLENVVGVSEQGFVDDMSESLIDPETGETLTGQNKNAKITPRNKRKELGMNDTSLIDAKCSSCQKTLRVSSTIAFGHSTIDSENNWKCNDCSTRRSRRERSRDIK